MTQIQQGSLFTLLVALTCTVTPLRGVAAQALGRPDASPSATSSASQQVTTRRLDSLFASIDSATTPGCAVGVALRDRAPFFRSYGVQSLEQRVPIDSATIFEAGSVSKQVTAAAVLLLAREGKLSLDDPARKWIPELWSGLPRFTVGDLLYHVAGVRDYGDLLEIGGWPRGTRVYDTEDELRLLARQRALNFTPRNEYLYSNSGYVLASVIVARAAGQSFAAYAQRAIFTPLGMHNTSWRDDYTRVVPRRAQGYTPDDSGHWKLDMPIENSVGHAGLLTTAEDLLRWQARFAITGDAARELIGGPMFVRDMEAPITLRTGRVSPYALGLELDSLNGERVVSHAGWTTGYKAYVGRIPARGVAVALLCNAGSLNTEDLGPVLLAIAADVPLPRTEEPALGAPADTVADRPLASLAGTYRSERTRQTVRVRAYANGISVNTWTGYRRVDDSTFVGLTTARVLRTTRDTRGHVSGYRLSLANDTVRYTRVAPWQPDSAVLARIVGRYRCSEADADVEIVRTRSGLSLQRRGRLQDHLTPRYRDAFDVDGQSWLLNIARDPRGQITGLTFGSTRSRTVPCVRVGADPVNAYRASP